MELRRLVIIIIVLVLNIVKCAISETVVVRAPDGVRFGGLRTDSGKIDSFLGIKYGSALRFERARPYKYQTDALVDATAYGQWCHQASYPEIPNPENEYSEDCLFLNIWRSTSHDVNGSKNGLKPVLVYIHGGGFTQGGGADVLFKGSNLAAASGAIIITINYRLGPLGFLVKNAGGAGGMNGLTDAVLALHWVQHNILAFGGDPDAVTLFGESAGGCATCTLSVSPVARGLFNRAIVESGPCVGPWQPETVDEGLALRDALMLRFGVTSVEGLRAVPAENLSWPLPTGGYFLDDFVMQRQPAELFATAEGPHVDTFVIGANSYDGTSELLPWFPPPNASAAQFNAALALQFGPSKVAQVAAQYPPSRFSGSASAAFVQADSDFTNACPNLHIARALAATKTTRVFLYRFAHLQERCDLGNSLGVVPAEERTWASHGAEIMFVWNNTEFNSPLDGEPVACGFNAAELALSASMQSLWASTAHTGLPTDSTPAGVTWPEFDRDGEAREHTLQFGIPRSATIEGLKTDDCELWLD